jgi:hypothetical protein
MVGGWLTLPVTVTVTLLTTLPTGPVHVSVYPVVALGVTGSLPLRGLLPLQPPLAVQLVRFALLQVKVLVPPGTILVGVAVRVTLGSGPLTETTTLRVAVPLVPLQVRT